VSVTWISKAFSCGYSADRPLISDTEELERVGPPGVKPTIHNPYYRSNLI